MATKQNEVRFLMRKLYLNANKCFKAYISKERQIKIHLREMIRYYEHWRRLVKYRKNWWNTQTEKERIDEFERYIVYYLLAVCFFTSFEDSDVVSNLLSTLYDTDEQFFVEMFGGGPMRLLDSKKYGLEDLDTIVRHPSNYIGEIENFPVVISSEPWEKQVQQINYFMKHRGFEGKLSLLRFGEHWLRHEMKIHAVPDSRMCSKRESVFFTDPDKLSKYLDHGLFSNANERNESVGGLLKGIVEIWFSGGFHFSGGLLTEYPFSTHSKRNAKALEVAAMLLRAVKSVDVSVLFSFMRVQIPNEILRTMVSVPSEEILPMLKSRCIGPQKLQHLCRWQIRKQMCDYGQLPEGIHRLSLPKLLQQYLRLRRDENDVAF